MLDMIAFSIQVPFIKHESTADLQGTTTYIGKKTLHSLNPGAFLLIGDLEHGKATAILILTT